MSPTNPVRFTYVGGAVLADPVKRTATAPTQVWQVKCEKDGLNCSNNSYDGKSVRPIYDDKGNAIELYDKNGELTQAAKDYKGKIEHGDKRQIFNINDVTSDTNGILTLSNNGIMNPLNDALKNATRQNFWNINEGPGVYVIYNQPTSNPISELLYAGYDKTNDMLGGRLRLTNAEKMNIQLFKHAQDNGYLLDINNHSRGGLTASVAIQNANRNDLTNIPLRELRFFGTATNVDRLANFVSEKNKYVDPITGKPTEVYSAVHYTDFVGRSPLLVLRSPWIVGGNSPTGGIENTWFTYSHSGYDMNKPEAILKDAQGFNIDKNGYRTNTVENKNPYFDEHDKLWNKGQRNNLVPKDKENPSLPISVKPKSSQNNEYIVPQEIK